MPTLRFLLSLLFAAGLFIALSGCQGLFEDLEGHQFDDSQQTNACGGEEELTLDGEQIEPGEECGPCSDGVAICASPNSLACSGASETNPCGGCTTLDDEPGQTCNDNGLWVCDGEDDLICEVDLASFLLSVDYQGHHAPDELAIFLLHSSQSCDEASQIFLEQHSWPIVEHQTQHVAFPSAGDREAVFFPDISSSESYTMAATALEHRGESVEIAFGCIEDVPGLNAGEQEAVEIVLFDRIPHFSTTYEVTQSIPLLEEAPEHLQDMIEILSQISASPAEFLLGCNTDDNNCGTSPGIADLIVEYDTVGSSGSFADHLENIRSGSISSTIDDYLQGVFAANMTAEAWEWSSDVDSMEVSLMGMVRHMEVAGEFNIYAQPTVEVSNGLPRGQFNPDAPIVYQWNETTFYFPGGCSGGDDECAGQSFDITSLEGFDAPPEITLTAQVVPSHEIEIDSHQLNLNYNEFLYSAMEQTLFPRLTDDEDITTVGQFLNEAIDCADLADGVGDTFASSVENFCYELLEFADQAIYAHLGAESSEQGGTIEFEGHPDFPCVLYQPETYTSGDWPGEPGPYVESFGDLNADEPGCSQTVRVDQQGDGEIQSEALGFFHATRR